MTNYITVGKSSETITNVIDQLTSYR